MSTSVSQIPVNPGFAPGSISVAAYQFTDSDAVVKVLQRIVVADQNGNDLFSSSNPAQVNLAGGIAGEDLTNNVLGTTDKPVISAAYNPSVSTSFGTQVSVLAKATPGNFLSIYASNISSAVAYLQLFNTTAAPTTGATPLFSFLIPAGMLGDAANEPGILEIGQDWFRKNGYYMSSGVAWGISNSRGTFSPATAGNHTVNLTYI